MLYHGLINQIIFAFQDIEKYVLNEISPDVILCGWLGLKHQLTN